MVAKIKTKWTNQQKAIWLNLKERIDLNKTYYVYITSTTNNTILTLVDDKGRVLAWRSCGMRFVGKQKSSEIANSELTEEMVEILKIIGIKNISIFFRGLNSWQNEILDYFVENFEILEIKDITMIPFNGCRKWKYKLKNKKRNRDSKNKKDLD